MYSWQFISYPLGCFLNFLNTSQERVGYDIPKNAYNVMQFLHTSPSLYLEEYRWETNLKCYMIQFCLVYANTNEDTDVDMDPRSHFQACKAKAISYGYRYACFSPSFPRVFKNCGKTNMHNCCRISVLSVLTKLLYRIVCNKTSV